MPIKRIELKMDAYLTHILICRDFIVNVMIFTFEGYELINYDYFGNHNTILKYINPLK